MVFREAGDDNADELLATAKLVDAFGNAYPGGSGTGSTKTKRLVDDVEVTIDFYPTRNTKGIQYLIWSAAAASC